MARLPARGVTILTPNCSPSSFVYIEEVMSEEFDRDFSFADEQRRTILYRLALVNGLMERERARPVSSKVLKQLDSLVASLGSIEAVLNVFSEGFREITPEQMEVASILRERLAMSAAIDGDEAAGKFIRDLSDKLVILKQAASDASSCVKGYQGRAGRPINVGYDWFSVLVQTLCEHHGLSSKLSRDPITDEPRGPFYRLAELTETYLLRTFRSPTPDARYKRLREGLRRRKGNMEKNPHLAEAFSSL